MRTRIHTRRFHIVVLSTAITLVLLLFVLSDSNVRSLVMASLKRSPAGAPSTPSPDTWIVRPSFPGKVLHWTLKNYNPTPGETDPHTSVTLDENMWELVGTDGLPSVFRVRFRYLGADGRFLQEIEETRTRETILLRTYDASSPGGRCTTQHWSPTMNTLRSFLPLFANERILSRIGYHESTGPPTPQQPGTNSFPGVAPLLTYDPGTTVHQWVLRESLGNHMSQTRTVEIGEHDRVLLIQDQQTSAQGKVVNERRTSYGPLQVYDSQVVVKALFSPQSCSTDLHS